MAKIIKKTLTTVSISFLYTYVTFHKFHETTIIEIWSIPIPKVGRVYTPSGLLQATEYKETWANSRHHLVGGFNPSEKY